MRGCRLSSSPVPAVDWSWGCRGWSGAAGEGGDGEHRGHPTGGGSCCCAAGRHPGGPAGARLSTGHPLHSALSFFCLISFFSTGEMLYLPPPPRAELMCVGLSRGGWSPAACRMLPAAGPRQRGPSPARIRGVFLGASPWGASPGRSHAVTSTEGSEGCGGGWAKTGRRGLGVPQLCAGGEGRDEARSTGMCGAGGELRGGAGTTAAGPLGARCGAAYGPQAAPHPPLGCCHPVPRLGWELKKLFRRGGGSGATSASAGCCLVPSWASPAGPPPASSPRPSDIWVLAAAGGGEDLGLRQRLAAGCWGQRWEKGFPPHRDPPAGSVTAPGDAPKALERRLGALGETQELAACVCVCAHTCERAARGPTGTSPRPPPAFLGAAVPASEGGAQPKPLGEPPPPPTKVPCLGNLKPVSSKIFY